MTSANLQLCKMKIAYFEGNGNTFTLLLNLRSTEFYADICLWICVCSAENEQNNV